MYFTVFIKWKTGNQLKIHLVYLLADENEYIGDSFVVVFKLKQIFKINKKNCLHI